MDNATSYPYTARAVGDLGPGTLPGSGAIIAPAQLAQMAASSDPDIALGAEAVRRQTQVNCNFACVAFSIAPPANLGGVQPASVVVVAQQVLGQNPNRKSLFYSENITAGRQASGVTQSGFALQPGQSSPSALVGTQASGLLSQMIQTSFLGEVGNAGIDSPVPTNPVTVIAQWGPPAVAGTPIVPLTGVVYEGS